MSGRNPNHPEKYMDYEDEPELEKILDFMAASQKVQTARISALVSILDEWMKMSGIRIGDGISLRDGVDCDARKILDDELRAMADTDPQMANHMAQIMKQLDW